MPANILVILGSARKNGDTHSYVDYVFAETDYHLLDLLDYKISPYSYLNDYPEDDDFLKIADEILKYDYLVFATPVYWYAMSGIMKNLFDRFTDLVTFKKQMGRQLKNKSSFLLTVGSDEGIPNGFETPFKLTSEYLDISYQGSLYYSVEHEIPEEEKERLKLLFINLLK